MAHVLLVEDDPRLRLLLAEFLEAAGHAVDRASDGAQALARMRQDRPDALVLDLQMPVLDGWGLLRACREMPGLAELPVVVMSGMEDAAATVAELGVEHCLRKPFDLDQLAAALEELGVTDAPVVRVCTYCGAERPTYVMRVFTRTDPDGRWRLCQRCWRFLEVGFGAHRPTQDLQQRLEGPVPIHATEARGWITTGLAQVGRCAKRSAAVVPERRAR
jgi:CheY-like chemotaxis protein